MPIFLYFSLLHLDLASVLFPLGFITVAGLLHVSHMSCPSYPLDLNTRHPLDDAVCSTPKLESLYIISHELTLSLCRIMCVCMYVCVCVCMYVCMCVCMGVIVLRKHLDATRMKREEAGEN
jgi:hypothetical protein